MKPHVVAYKPDLHEALIKDWFERRKFPAPNPRFLPPIGGIVYMRGEPICAGFLFRSDAKAAIIGHLVSNPSTPGADRHKGLDFLIAELENEAKAQGFEMVCCSTNLPGLMERFERIGYTKTDTGVANFGRVLCL